MHPRPGTSRRVCAGDPPEREAVALALRLTGSQAPGPREGQAVGRRGHRALVRRKRRPGRLHAGPVRLFSPTPLLSLRPSTRADLVGPRAPPRSPSVGCKSSTDDPDAPMTVDFIRPMIAPYETRVALSEVLLAKLYLRADDVAEAEGCVPPLPLLSPLGRAGGLLTLVPASPPPAGSSTATRLRSTCASPATSRSTAGAAAEDTPPSARPTVKVLPDWPEPASARFVSTARTRALADAPADSHPRRALPSVQSHTRSPRRSAFNPISRSTSFLF